MSSLAGAPLPGWLEAFRARLGAEVVETHISWLVLADGFAWKIKKPLTLPFLDYGSAALRRYYCAEELRLNRVFAPDLYLGLESVDDSGEWAVKMRRFAESQRLDHVCSRGALTPAHLSGLARLVHTFQRRAPVAGPDTPFGDAPAVLDPALDNFTTLRPLAPALSNRLDCLAGWTRNEFARLHDSFAVRKAEGRIREGHGDLHLGNLVLLDGQVTPFDCIEFNEDLRWIDVASELAFTWMDLLDRGRPDLAGWLLSEWLDESGDHGAIPVFRFYAVYKAMVRAKVAALSGDPVALERYIGLAERLTCPPPARLIITHGLSGSGKTTRSTAMLMADPQAATLRLRSDVERKRLYGVPPLTRGDTLPDGGIYTPEATRLTFSHLARQTAMLLDAGWSVIVDAAFLRRAGRDDFHTLAANHGADFAILACSAPLEVLAERLEARRDDASDATVSVMHQQTGWLEPLSDAERRLVIDLPPGTI